MTIQLRNKYTYNQEQFNVEMTFDNTIDDRFDNCYTVPKHTQPDKWLFTPSVVIPERGAFHNQRIGDKIKITSIRWNLRIKNYKAFWNKSQIENLHTDTTGNILRTFARTHDQSASLPIIPNSAQTSVQHLQTQPNFNLRYDGFSKWRIFVIDFDREFANMTAADLMQWFMETYCYDTESTPADDYWYEHSVSTHESLMRVTTPWTGRFRILLDKKFSLSDAKTDANISLTIPINKTYEFEEDSNNLLYPNLRVFLLPPMSWVSDIDLPSAMLMSKIQDGATKTLWHIHSFTKVNFIDL